jgi:23S rRNA (uridine2552-2'-O)-methyltransferase
MPKAFSPQDHYFTLAKKQGLRARSAFKLEEILTRIPSLCSQNIVAIDFGSAPGSFLQILTKKCGSKSLVIGIDLQEIEPLSGVHLLKGDIFSKEAQQDILDVLKGQKADLITSDLAPKTSGIRDIDQWKSIELNQRVLELAEIFLKKEGNLVAKIFVGEDFQEFFKEEFSPRFQKVQQIKPKASRDRSFESFLVGQGWKG